MADNRQSMTNTSSELLHGTLDTLVLKTLLEMRYGDDIAASRGH